MKAEPISKERAEAIAQIFYHAVQFDKKTGDKEGIMLRVSAADLILDVLDAPSDGYVFSRDYWYDEARGFSGDLGACRELVRRWQEDAAKDWHD